jgi:hypothetical protein
MGQYAPATGMDANAQGNGSQGGGGAAPDQAQAPDPAAAVQQVRELTDPLKQFLASSPALQPIAKKFDALIREILVTQASQQSQQTPSGQALPMGG